MSSFNAAEYVANDVRILSKNLHLLKRRAHTNRVCFNNGTCVWSLSTLLNCELQPVVTFSSNGLCVKDKNRYLGAFLDAHVTLNCHMGIVVQKASKAFVCAARCWRILQCRFTVHKNALSRLRAASDGGFSSYVGHGGPFREAKAGKRRADGRPYNHRFAPTVLLRDMQADLDSFPRHLRRH